MLFWLALTGMLIWRFVVYEPPQPVISKAGVLTHPACAKYSTELAVATCEQVHPVIIVAPSTPDNQTLDQKSDSGN